MTGGENVSVIYISENGAKLGMSENRLTIKPKDGAEKSVPAETVSGIFILGKAELSTPCMEQCLKRGIPVAFFSKGGTYFGRLISTDHVDAELQRAQCTLYETPFAVEFSKRIISAKIINQLTVLRRYARSRQVPIDDLEQKMLRCREKVGNSEDIPQIMGYEGEAAKLYFSGLCKCLDPDFEFQGRSRRPPKDPFNSLISFGYSVLLNEIYCEIELKGLNPYFGLTHQDREHHPTLASDLLEEWRAVIVDSLAMSLLNGHEIGHDDFERDDQNDGCYLTHEGLRRYLSKFDSKLETRMQYVKSADKMTFRTAIGYQINQLEKAIQEIYKEERH
jgi:CRISPR-associated protein Cas1